MWLKIGLIGSLLLGGLGAVWQYDRNAKAVGELQGTITALNTDLAAKDQTIEEKDAAITDLRVSRDTVNERLRTQITDHNEAVEAEVERRRQIALERDRAREALRIALDAIRTESENDVEFAHWLDQPVPAAAWDRLRAVSE